MASRFRSGKWMYSALLTKVCAYNIHVKCPSDSICSVRYYKLVGRGPEETCCSVRYYKLVECIKVYVLLETDPL